MKTLKGDGFTVNVVKSKRRKTMALKVTPQGASIFIPSALPLYFAQDFIEKKSSWIKAKLHQQSQYIRPEKQFEHGETLHYLGKSYHLVLEQLTGKLVCVLDGEALICRGPINRVSKPAIRAACIAWYKHQAKNYLTQRTQELSALTGIQAKSITVKTYRARWGSCKLNGDIQYNWKLIIAPPDIIDYVIIHELCHIRHHNHSRQFWQLVVEHCPNYAASRNWLKQYGYSLDV